METMTTKNKFGITINMCCASCAHNLYAINDTKRHCDAGEGSVSYLSWCSQWRMRPSLEKAGSANGRVKKKAYLDFVRKEMGRADIPELRRLFEKKNGSIYVNKY